MKKRELRDLGNGIHVVPLTQGKEALIDSADAELVGRSSWCARRRRGRWYAQASIGGCVVGLHRLLCGVDGFEVDHVNHDGLDNRRANLRAATTQQNQYNALTRADNTSGFKGVTWSERTKKWLAQIRHNGRRCYLGIFATPELAHAAYRAAAEKIHGEFACFGSKKEE